MADQEMAFVAVIGGLSNLKEQEATAAKAMAREIGGDLAKAGFGLVVYFSKDDFLESHVVSGYAAARGGGPREIRVRYAERQRDEIAFKEDDRKSGLFKHRLFPGQDWEAPFYRSLVEAEGVDAVLLLGGGTSTLIAGQIAVARRLPILAVDRFGGAAAKIWTQIAQAAPNNVHPSWSNQPVAEFVRKLQQDCAAAASDRQTARRREAQLAAMTSRRRWAVHTACAFIGLLVALFLGMVYTPIPSAYPAIMFLGLIAAGATGSLTRALLWEQDGDDPLTSLVLGAIAGFVVGLAYLIPQWIGAPDVLKAEVIKPTDKIQFASAVLVAVPAGVGFNTVFERLRKEARTGPIKPSR